MRSLTRAQALGRGGEPTRGARAPRVPTPLEIVAQQALALQSQANALVGTVLGMLEQQAPEEPESTGPVMPPVFGGGHQHEQTEEERSP
jgi:phage terminase small subunit